ncbi:hypothetical protein [Coleofasciculus sp. FACHB-125]|uniref:hypothetical protein n=1 Tax=Coleofasciculus sp. FACHB-125 TaxID=2692784 RepID=UPI001684C2EF|nr:hypothetical protein [Coleofasciculus sp. FACHB-125]
MSTVLPIQQGIGNQDSDRCLIPWDAWQHYKRITKIELKRDLSLSFQDCSGCS